MTEESVAAMEEVNQNAGDAFNKSSAEQCLRMWQVVQLVSHSIKNEGTLKIYTSGIYLDCFM